MLAFPPVITENIHPATRAAQEYTTLHPSSQTLRRLAHKTTRETASFLIGSSPFVLCVVIAKLLDPILNLPLPPIAIALPLTALLLFTLKPKLEKLAYNNSSPSNLSPLWHFLDQAIETTANRLLFVMPLCFVPIGVGIVKDTNILLQAWLVLFIVIVPHTLVTIVATIAILKKTTTPPPPLRKPTTPPQTKNPANPNAQ